MQTVYMILTFIWTHLDELIAALTGVLSALIAFFMLIPGPEPERTLQRFVDWISGHSRKPKE